MTTRTILVTGATGRQGQAFIRSLSKSSEANLDDSQAIPQAYHVLALTRSAASRAPDPELKDGGKTNVTVELVQGNLDKPETVQTIFESHNIFAVFLPDGDGEEKQGKMLIDLALQFSVFAFRGESQDNTLVGDRAAKVSIEHHLREKTQGSSMSWTILRPGFFMENYIGLIGSITVAALRAGLAKDTKIFMVCTEDIGRVAAGVVRDPGSFRSSVIAIGEHSTIGEQQQAYRRATGKALPSAPLLLGRVILKMNKHAKGLVLDIERVHALEEGGAHPELQREMDDAKRAACQSLTSFESWATSGDEGPQAKEVARWNRLTLPKLMTGRS
ncbi:NAD(P)-binding protein [Hymenopellis radicata]|nr:NAD(P)-binding protein [Hymenopellis radicata]